MILSTLYGFQTPKHSGCVPLRPTDPFQPKYPIRIDRSEKKNYIKDRDIKKDYNRLLFDIT